MKFLAHVLAVEGSEIERYAFDLKLVCREVKNGK